MEFSISFVEKPAVWSAFSSITLLLSIIATSFIIFISLKSRLYKDILGKMALMNIIADFIYAIFKFLTYIPIEKTQEYCEIVQVLAGYGRGASLIWSMLFGHAMLHLTKSDDVRSINRYRKIYVATAFITPIFLEVLSVLNDFYIVSPKNDDYCSMYFDETSISQMVITTVPTTAICVLSVFLYVYACYRLYRKGIWLKEVLTLLLFPSIIIFCWIPIRVVDLIVTLGGNPNGIIMLYLNEFSHLVGFFQCIAYGRNRNVQSEIRKLWCCRSRKPEIKRSYSAELSLEEQESIKQSLLKRTLKANNNIHDSVTTSLRSSEHPSFM